MNDLAELHNHLKAANKLVFEMRVAQVTSMEIRNARGRSPLPGAPKPVYAMPEGVDTEKRSFHKQVFLGAGDTSGKQLMVLRERLEYAFECLGCIQQSESDEEMAEIPALTRAIEDVIKDIAKGLLGTHVTVHPTVCPACGDRNLNSSALGPPPHNETRWVFGCSQPECGWSGLIVEGVSAE